MKRFFLFLFLLIASINPVLSQSNLLESVKKNPDDAIKMCNKFKEFNSKGVSASSDKAIEFVSKKINRWHLELIIFLSCFDQKFIFQFYRLTSLFFFAFFSKDILSFFFNSFALIRFWWSNRFNF